ncbi:Type VI secretion system (T6SS), amidase effector protein 4 [Kosakonia arachidis]|uniref:Type VI secretion system (T6SS), amidase effector protein 4 n=1 Tax=Kosakonia arachidis TaxID=551989 RepID=A0A1I7DAI8_9ENTR|nr:type VI secretion system amidase effector protein Tae4 [Kosakonia arachidis]SFU08647.1 Type VI secretion system (T6SS), amidase effector protein 4 [Kosakonia arachidis]
MGNRPSFVAAWGAAAQIYDPKDPLTKVKNVIGGKVRTNFEIPESEGGWVNSCAVRMSYVLNYTGFPVPRINGITVSGADKKWYFFRVGDVINWLTRQWGKPDLIVSYPSLPVDKLHNKKGIILFSVDQWDDATGHATFWNGLTCSDHCYFNAPNTNYTTTKASFWELP